MTSAAPDLVNHPPHYRGHPSGHEVINGTEALPCCLANALKYSLRAPHKHDDPLVDWRKAEWYLLRHLSWMERHPVRAFFGKLLTLIVGRANDDILEDMFLAETDEAAKAVIACCQTGFEMDVDHAIDMVRIKLAIFSDDLSYPSEVLNA